MSDDRIYALTFKCDGTHASIFPISKDDVWSEIRTHLNLFSTMDYIIEKFDKRILSVDGLAFSTTDFKGSEGNIYEHMLDNVLRKILGKLYDEVMEYGSSRWGSIEVKLELIEE